MMRLTNTLSGTASPLLSGHNESALHNHIHEVSSDKVQATPSEPVSPLSTHELQFAGKLCQALTHVQADGHKSMEDIGAELKIPAKTLHEYLHAKSEDLLTPKGREFLSRLSPEQLQAIGSMKDPKDLTVARNTASQQNTHLSEGMKQAIANYITNDHSPTYAGLKALMPPGFSDKQCIKAARDIANQELTKKMDAVPKSRQKIPSTVQVQECSWKASTPGGSRPIKIIGVRHGYMSINQNSIGDLQWLLKRRNHKLFVEEGFNKFLSTKNLPKGIDVQDLTNHPDDKYKYAKVGIEVLSYALLPLSLAALTGVGIGRMINRGINGLPMREDVFPSYHDQLQKLTHHLPESLEIDAHKNLPYSVAKELDSNNLWAAHSNHRSGYMAGYLAAMSEKMEEDIPITFLCGGAHLPRVVSCLDFSRAEDMPKSLKENFDKGYQYAMGLKETSI